MAQSRPSIRKIFVKETPIGTVDSVNLSFRTSYDFNEETLMVYLSGALLEPVDLDIHVDKQGFDIVLDPNDEWRLNVPPKQGEAFETYYMRRI